MGQKWEGGSVRNMRESCIVTVVSVSEGGEAFVIEAPRGKGHFDEESGKKGGCG